MDLRFKWAIGNHQLAMIPVLLAKRYFDCQKTKGAGFKPPREAARSYNSREFSLEFGSGSPLPLINALYNGYLWTSRVRGYRR
jgi:hypothetical protein